METIKKESRFSANFPYLILGCVFPVLLYLWLETYDISRLKIPFENFTIEDGTTLVVIWGCVGGVWRSIKNYFIK